MRRIFRGAAVFAALFLSVPAAAQDITLVARNGGLALSGQLIAYDGEFYRIASAYYYSCALRRALRCALAAVI